MLGNEDSRITGVTPALGWGVAGGVRSGSSSGLSLSFGPAYSSASLCISLSSCSLAP